MIRPCSGDPLICIEFVVLVIGEFLKDWTTLAMLAALLGLLLTWRSNRRKAAEADYAKKLGAYDDRRREEGTQAQTWNVDKGPQNGP